MCVDDSGYDIDDEKAPKKGVVYTVRSIHPKGYAIRVNEIINKERFYTDSDTGKIIYDECWFMASRFAPIQEYGDSLSIAMELIQDMERVDKPVNPKVKEVV